MAFYLLGCLPNRVNASLLFAGMLAKQGKRIRFHDLHRYDPADQLSRAVEDDDPVADRAAGELQRGTIRRLLAAGLARPVDEDFQPAAEVRTIQLLADCVLHRQQVVVAAAFDFLRDVVGVECGRSWSPGADYT